MDPTAPDPCHGPTSSAQANPARDLKNLTVGGWMTTPVHAISAHTSVPAAYNLMLQYSIRRLPVVDAGGLIGIVTLGDLREARPSSVAPSLSELTYLLARATVAQVMTYHPFTSTPQTSLRDAAELMRIHKVGGLPVVDRGNALVGILTESDLLRMLTTLWDASLAVLPASDGTVRGH